MSNEHGLDDGKVATGWRHGRELPGYHGNEGMVGADMGLLEHLPCRSSGQGLYMIMGDEELSLERNQDIIHHYIKQCGTQNTRPYHLKVCMRNMMTATMVRRSCS
jgi:hypothetical protein